MPRGDWWKYKTLEERSGIRARMSEGAIEREARKTLEEKIRISIKTSDRLVSRSLEEVAATGAKAGKTLEETWEARSPGERVAIGNSISRGKIEAWGSVSLEERRVIGAKISVSNRAVWANLSSEEGSERLRRSFHSPEGKERGNESLRVWWASLSSGRKKLELEKRWRGGWGRSQSPTSPEISLGLYLQDRSPGEWLYNGIGDVVIGGRRPDFININGKKEVIEVFGTYWHLDEDEAIKIEHYKGYGFGCRVMWEYDCYDWVELDRVLIC